MSKTQELFDEVADKLVALIESGETGEWEKPWQSLFSAAGLPTNATTQKEYHGINTLVLWMQSAEQGYESSLWATFKQWQSVGAKVRKGERATRCIKWGVTYNCATCGSKGHFPCNAKGHEVSKRVFASNFCVFNAAQVDGYELPKVADLTEPERVEQAEAFVQATGADVTHAAQGRAFYRPSSDTITMPLREYFGTAQGYYGTLLHELTHWTGHKTRMGRKFCGMFGSPEYAAEELIAEFGAAFLAARFRIEVEPSIDHASYLKGWVGYIKSEPMALYKAAKAAQQAADYALSLATEREEVAA